MPPPPSLVVFTDLDGTLLDARTYAAGPARAALRRLEILGVPVVCCSSKTAAEQRAIRQALGLGPAPFIVENGSAVLVPDGSGLAVDAWPRAAAPAGERLHVLGRPAADVRAAIARSAAALGRRLTGYADLTVAQVAALTGLAPRAAGRARRRDYSETVVDDLPPEVWAGWEAALAAEGLSCRHGGRFRTVTGAAADKGSAVRLVAGLFAAARGQPVLTAGLGDGANDESLLAAVDRPFLLPRADGTWAPMVDVRLRRMARPGPRGWHDAIHELLADVQPAAETRPPGA